MLPARLREARQGEGHRDSQGFYDKRCTQPFCHRLPSAVSLSLGLPSCWTSFATPGPMRSATVRHAGQTQTEPSLLSSLPDATSFLQPCLVEGPGVRMPQACPLYHSQSGSATAMSYSLSAQGLTSSLG